MPELKKDRHLQGHDVRVTGHFSTRDTPIGEPTIFGKTEQQIRDLIELHRLTKDVVLPQLGRDRDTLYKMFGRTEVTAGISNAVATLSRAVYK